MKKTIVALILALLLIGAFAPVEARAEQDYINSNLGAVEAGLPFSCTLCDTVFPAGSSVSLRDGFIPDGCSWYTSPVDGGVQLFIQGTPRTAGSYSFALTVSCAEPLTDALVQCAISVNASQPQVQTGSNVSCNAGDAVSISVFASKNPDDGGTLSYQWYSSPGASTSGGTAISGANSASYSPPTAESGYYYCMVTNNNGSATASALSGVIAVQVTQPQVSSISVASLPAKTDYLTGESFDSKGLQINVHYSNGNYITVSEGFTTSPESFREAGSQLVTVSYKDVSCSFNVNVELGEPVLESISVVKMPAKTVYNVGDTMDSTGMTLRLFTDQGYEDVTSGFSCIPNSFLAAGTQTVTVRYEDKSCTFTVEVREEKEELQSISINSKPAKLSYIKGEQLDIAGLTLIMSTNKGNMMVTEGFTCSPTILSNAGQQVITVLYQGKTCTFTVEVSEKGGSTQATPDVTPRPNGGNAASDAVREDRGDGSGAVTVIIVACVVAVLAVGGYLLLAYTKSKQGKK